MVTGDVADGAGTEGGTGPGQDGASGSEAVPAAPVGDHVSGQFDAGDFIVDHDAAPSQDEQPTTTS